MKAYISNSLIKKLIPKGKQYDVRDTKLVGFLIRVNPTGKMSYVCEYKRGKRINIAKVGLISPTQARDKAIEILGDVIKGQEPNSKSRQPERTLRDFIENDYAPWFTTHRKSSKKTIGRLNRCFFEIFGNTPLQEITTMKDEQWRTQRLHKPCKPETINGDIATLKAV